MSDHERQRKLNIETQKNLSPYSKLFFGHTVRLSEIEFYSPHTLPALQRLIEDRRVISEEMVDVNTGERVTFLMMPEFKKVNETKY